MISEINEAEISNTTVQKAIYKVYSSRFYVICIFSLLAFNQCAIWLTFSPVARNAEAYYNISEATVDLLLNWGPIIFVPSLPATCALLNRPSGLRYCVIILAVTDFIAALFRILPSIITMATTNTGASSIALPFIHIGQILNAACGPLVMAPVSQLSCLWFAPHERTRATTFAIVANNFGASVAFIINPLIVSLGFNSSTSFAYSSIRFLKELSHLTTMLGYANNCLNPILYVFLSDSFREEYAVVLSCFRSNETSRPMNLFDNNIQSLEQKQKKSSVLTTDDKAMKKIKHSIATDETNEDYRWFSFCHHRSKDQVHHSTLQSSVIKSQSKNPKREPMSRGIFLSRSKLSNNTSNTLQLERLSDENKIEIVHQSSPILDDGGVYCGN